MFNIVKVIKNTVISTSSNMAEGGFEMDDAAFDAAMDDLADGAEEETEFMDDLENTHEALSTTPPWAGGAEMPDGLYEGDLASNDYQDSVVARFTAERSKYARPARLEFKAWKLLTWKNDPKNTG